MASVILTIVFSAVLGALGWLLLGTRFQFLDVERSNDWLNLGAYSLLVLPLVFVLVFFLVEAL